MTATRPPYQLELDLPMPGRGEASRLDWQEVEAVTATAERESPAPTEHLMEAICDSDNLETALRAVVRNKGAPGVDGITVQQLPGILKARRNLGLSALFRFSNRGSFGKFFQQPFVRPAGGVVDTVGTPFVPTSIQRSWRAGAVKG